MTIKTRDFYIDNVRGIAALSVIFIHTTFWSGGSYVPDIVRSLSLIFDVPIFFVLTGFVFRATGKIDSLQQSRKLIAYFALYVLVLNTLTSQLTFDQIISALTITSAQAPAFPVINGSYWFVPMYVVTIIISQILLQSFGWKAALIMPAALLYYTLSYTTGFYFKHKLLGVNLHSLLFYISCVLMGYFFYSSKGKNFWLLGAFTCALIFFLMYSQNPNVINLQKYKLQLSLPYVISSMFAICLVMFGIVHGKHSWLTWIGQRAIYFYMAQGIGASVLYYFVHKINAPWLPKLAMMFITNIVISTVVVFAIIYTVSCSQKLIDFFKRTKKMATSNIG